MFVVVVLVAGAVVLAAAVVVGWCLWFCCRCRLGCCFLVVVAGCGC